MLALFAARTATGSILEGPIFPPPGAYTFSESGSPGDGGIGNAGGKTFYFSNISQAARDQLYWGALNSEVKLSLNNSSFSDPNETMYYNGSTGPTNIVFMGSSVLNGVRYQTRCRMTSSVNFVSGGVVGVSQSLVPVTSGTEVFQATMYMEVYDISGFVSLNNWVPVYPFYNASHQDIYSGGCYTSFSAGFWYFDQPPTINTGGQTSLTMGAGTTAGPFTLNVSDDNGFSLSATSSNPDIPSTGVTFSFNGTSYSYYLQSVNNGVGQGYITLTATDTVGQRTQTQVFVTCDPPPAVSHFANALIQMNSSMQTFSFTASDALSMPLTITPITSNTTLVPPGYINVIQTNYNAYGLQVTPAPNQYGTAVIGVRVANTYLSSNSTFTLTVNSPPSLTANNGLTVNQSATGTITSSLLQATDPDNTAAQIIFTIAPGGNGGPPHNGTLFKSGVALAAGNTFTMSDIQANHITYQNGGSCAQGDDFEFGVTDTSGGVLNSGGHTVFTFPITIKTPLIPPVAINATNAVPLGGSVSGTLNALNTDCVYNSLVFSITVPPTLGSITSFNATNGQYTYTASNGLSGQDTFQFQANNGALSSVSPGTITLNIQDTPPTGTASTFNVDQGSILTSNLSATDPDLPPQTLTFSIVSNATKGTVTLENATNGLFVYAPQPSRFGQDTFTFNVSDGLSTSATATATINIRPTAARFGNLLISEQSMPAILLVNLSNDDVGIISHGGLLNQPSFLASEPGGTILVAQLSGGVLRIDPATGIQTVVISNSSVPFAVGLAREAGGTLLVDSLGGGTVNRFTTNGTLVTNISIGNPSAPAGVAVATNGQIFAANAAFFASGTTNAIVQIDPATLAQTVLSSGGLLSSPVGVAVEPSGNLLVTEPMSNALTRITVPGGAQSNLTSGGTLNGEYGVAVDIAGNIYAANSGNGSLTQVDPVTGAQTLLLPSGSLGQPFGIAVAGQPVAAPVITGVQVIAPGQVQVSLTGYPGTTYSLISASNLFLPATNWIFQTTTTETSPGNFNATDTGATNALVRFYRARFP